MTRYQNPFNQHTESFSLPVESITCLAFGPVYFVYRRIWGHAVLSLLMALCTSGLSLLIYSLFVRPILHDHYLNQGWHQLG